MTNIDYKKITSPYVQKYNIAPPIPNNIVFYNDIEGKKVEVLRITKDGIMANPNVPVDEAADAVIRVLDAHIKQLVNRTWVGLTDEDRQAAFESLPDMLDGFLNKWGWLHFAKAIETKLKEKNNG